jgi:hypothetical protein
MGQTSAIISGRFAVIWGAAFNIRRVKKLRNKQSASKNVRR